MTREEILEKAIREYPIGTIHTGAAGYQKFKVDRIPYYSNEFIHSSIFGGGMGCIYNTGTKHWAKIISKPEPEFILPEKWCVRIKNFSMGLTVTGYIKNTKGYGFSWYKTSPQDVDYIFNNKNSWFWKNEDHIDIKSLILEFTEITFEQFKKYVLKEGTTSNNPNDVVTAVTDKYYSITQIETQLLKDYDKEDVKDIIKSIKTIK